jgi:hypothetical protein
MGPSHGPNGGVVESLDEAKAALPPTPATLPNKPTRKVSDRQTFRNEGQ